MVSSNNNHMLHAAAINNSTASYQPSLVDASNTQAGDILPYSTRGKQLNLKHYLQGRLDLPSPSNFGWRGR
jgi:hypothetical protein